MKSAFLSGVFETIRKNPSWPAPGLDEYFMILAFIERRDQPLRTFDEFAFLLETAWLKNISGQKEFRDILESRRQEIIRFLDYTANPEPEPPAPEPVIPEPVPAPEPEPQPVIDPKPVIIPEPLPDLPSPAPIGEENLYSDFGETHFTLGTTDSGQQSNVRLPGLEESAQPVTDSPYIFSNDYFPVKNRQLQQVWRSLKNRVNGPLSPLIDWTGTIKQTAQKGYFSGLCHLHRKKNKLKLFILIDHSDSMIAVEEFGRELCAAAVQSEVHREVVPWYFDQLPFYNETEKDYIVTDASRTTSAKLGSLLAGSNQKHIAVLIYSDAGALKNNYSSERLKESSDFIHFLYRRSGSLVWVNPAPKSRWQDNNAGYLYSSVPMFDTGRGDLERAVQVLKGKVTAKINNPYVTL